MRFFREVVRSPRQLRVVERKMASFGEAPRISRTQTRSWSVGSGAPHAARVERRRGGGRRRHQAGARGRANRDPRRNCGAVPRDASPRIRHERWVRWVSSPRWPSTAFPPSAATDDQFLGRGRSTFSPARGEGPSASFARLAVARRARHVVLRASVARGRRAKPGTRQNKGARRAPTPAFARRRRRDARRRRRSFLDHSRRGSDRDARERTR